MKDQERSLAKITHADYEIEDHGIPIWNIQFEYDEGSCQGLGGYSADCAFMMRFLNAVGVTSLSSLVGKSCWVTHSREKIFKIEPLHKKQGTPFVIEEWQEWASRRVTPVSAHEMATGEKR